jgi:two-component system, OmpR family, sensor histidine kinase QseC
MISFSLSVNVERALSISLARDSLTRERSAMGESSFTNTSSRLLSSPSTKGASTEIWRPDTFSVSEILSTGISSSPANSSGDGREDICYKDSMVYIVEKEETEPARILTTLFKDDEGQYYELTVSTPTIEKDDLKDAMLGWIIFLYIVLLLTILIVCIWIFHRSMKPLYNLLRWLDAYRIGRPNRPLKNETQITEFRKLNEAAIRNAERSEHIFEQQKQFIGNASHEMQTPLAICRNRLEMLMEDDSLSEAQLEELIKTHQTLEHITKLNKSLLLLSKIDNGQFSDTRTVEFNSMLKRYIEDYKEVYGYREIELTLDEQGIFRAEMNESLAVALITNLLKNAFVHNVDGGHIRIEITGHSMTFRNSGAGRPLDATHIFERFYQGSKKEGSTGLGLAIADSICKLQHLTLRYYFEKDEHCFELRKNN